MDDQTKKAHKKRIAKLRDYISTFSSPHGHRVLQDMMITHHMKSSTMVKSIDPIQLAFNEGERNVVLRILTILKTSPEELEKLLNRGDDYES